MSHKLKQRFKLAPSNPYFAKLALCRYAKTTSHC